MSLNGPEGHDGRDARRGRRLAVDLGASLGGRLTHPARVIDLSLVGCLVRSGAALDAGAVVNLRVDAARRPPRGQGASGGGVGRRCLAPGRALQFLAGLEFLALAAADEVRLRAFLDAEAKRRRGAHTPPR